MNERVKFIARYLQNEDPFAALCEDAGISRKTGYKWVERYEDGGVRALVDHSRAPRSHPHAVPAAAIDAIVAVRRRHPRWAPGNCSWSYDGTTRAVRGPSQVPWEKSCVSVASCAVAAVGATARRTPSVWANTRHRMRFGARTSKATSPSRTRAVIR